MWSISAKTCPTQKAPLIEDRAAATFTLARFAANKLRLLLHAAADWLSGLLSLTRPPDMPGLIQQSEDMAIVFGSSAAKQPCQPALRYRLLTI